MPFVLAEHESHIARTADDKALLFDAWRGGMDHLALVIDHGGEGGEVLIGVDSGDGEEVYKVGPGEATVLVLTHPRRILAWVEGEPATIALKLLVGEGDARGAEHRGPRRDHRDDDRRERESREREDRERGHRDQDRGGRDRGPRDHDRDRDRR